MADTAYESVLCVKNEVFVYKIPPRPSNRGYRASEWKLDVPDWTGRLRVVSINKDLFIKLEDKTSGELFAQCPVETYPSIAVESVMDSSRYFVLRIKDPMGRSAFIGIGFADRSDSFDLNVSLQDHFKWLKQEVEAVKATQELSQGPKLDLGFKAGQTITINLGNIKGEGARSKPKPRTTGAFLPPPPGGSGIRPPPPSAGGIHLPPSGASVGVATAPSSNNVPPTFAPSPAPSPALTPSPAFAPSPAPTASSGASNVDLLCDLGPAPTGSVAPLAPGPSLNPASLDVWGDFTGASDSTTQQSSNSGGSDGGWVQF